MLGRCAASPSRVCVSALGSVVGKCVFRTATGNDRRRTCTHTAFQTLLSVCKGLSHLHHFCAGNNSWEKCMMMALTDVSSAILFCV